MVLVTKMECKNLVRYTQWLLKSRTLANICPIVTMVHTDARPILGGYVGSTPTPGRQWKNMGIGGNTRAIEVDWKVISF